jgi:cyclopropane fatty-acyl-phospholipid synthase-like methyltransferase
LKFAFEILRFPASYEYFSSLISRNRSLRLLYSKHLQVKPGERLLDIGCGTGRLLQEIRVPIDYVGVDLSPRYLAFASNRFKGLGKFIAMSVDACAFRVTEHFDWAVAIGVLHHLDDKQVIALLEFARDSLRPQGLFMSADGCYVSNQTRLARFLLDHDRGRHIRSQSEYDRLIASVFPDREAIHYGNLLRVPYDHMVFNCRKPLGRGS